MKTPLFYLAIALAITGFHDAALAQTLEPIGTLTASKAIIWDAPTNGPAPAGYRLYVSPLATNDFTIIADLNTNRYEGSASANLNNLNGLLWLRGTAYNSHGLESTSSIPVLVNFVAGIPYPPMNYQFYAEARTLMALATNAIPASPQRQSALGNGTNTILKPSPLPFDLLVKPLDITPPHP